MQPHVPPLADPSPLSELSRVGRLLDEAIDLADLAGETLLGAQIAQALHLLDARVASLQGEAFARDRRPADPGDDGAPGH